MKYYIAILSIVLLFGCKKNPETLVPHISGYWEIQEVILNDGTKKEYTFSNTIDYLYVNDSLSGFRKKLKPNFTGTYQTSKDSEPFTLNTTNGQLTLNYKNKLSQWSETIIFANSQQLQIKNDANITYIYKRYTPININNE